VSDAYDPNAVEGDVTRGSQYMTKKDLRNIIAVVVVVLLALIPVYKYMERNSEKTLCVQNMRAISAALGQYAAENDDKFPAIYAMGSEAEPLLDPKGTPFAWTSVLSQYVNKRASFLCPSATAEEAATVATMRKELPEQKLKAHPGNTELVTYGMYAAYSTFLISQVENPNVVIAIAETSNMGARGSFDPLPFKNEAGQVIPFDAFAMGWDNSNKVPDSSTKSITRLAFYDVKNGEFKSDGPMRHDSGIHALTAGGALVLLKPDSALFSQRVGVGGGKWAVPATLGRD
jgi:hypothetical protein